MIRIWKTRPRLTDSGNLTRVNSRRGLAGIARFAAVCGVVSIAIAGCADDSADRRFANESARPEERATEPPRPTPLDEATRAGGVTVPSPTALLMARGAPRHIYLRAASDLWTISVENGEAKRIFSPDGDTISAIASSPSGDQVGLIVESNARAGEIKLIILTANGDRIREIDRLENYLAPMPETPQAAGSLSWSPQGDRLVASFVAGGLLSIPTTDDEPSTLASASAVPVPGTAALSPSGDAVAVTRPAADGGYLALYLLPNVSAVGTPAAASITQLSSSSNGQSVAEVAWLPNGKEVLFTERPAAGGVAGAGDLFAIDINGRDLRVVASAGRVAPVAQINRFSPSPDGRSVAYTIVIPSADGAVFHSLWLRPLANGSAVQLTVPSGETVTDFWWTAAGLIYRTVPSMPGGTDYDGQDFHLYRASVESPPEQLYASELATPVASPSAASPVASPLATPSTS